MFPSQPDAKSMVGAFDAGDEFINLFNKPESIAAVRLATTPKPGPAPDSVAMPKGYWHMVVRYCADGCLHCNVRGAAAGSDRCGTCAGEG